MVASQQKKILRVLDLVSQEQTDCFKRLLASVHVVSEEKVVCVRREASILKESE